MTLRKLLGEAYGDGIFGRTLDATKAVHANMELVSRGSVYVANIAEMNGEVLASRHHNERHQGALKRVWGSVTGATSREMVSLMRDMAQSQQTTIKLVLTLAVYHAENVAVMNEILGELNKAKGLHTRTASHIEFLYEQVQMIRDTSGKGKASKNKRTLTRIFAVTCAAAVVVAIMKPKTEGKQWQFNTKSFIKKGAVLREERRDAVPLFVASVWSSTVKWYVLNALFWGHPHHSDSDAPRQVSAHGSV